MTSDTSERRTSSDVTRPWHITLLLVEGFSQLAFACALEPFRIANWLSGQALYSWSLASIDGLPVRCSNGTEMPVQMSAPKLDDDQPLFILAGLDPWTQASATLIRYLKQEARRGTPMGALCSGTYLLAAAGVLSGNPVALHWAYHDSFIEKFPEANLRRSVFVADAPVVTASGGTAAADLMIHLIATQQGEALSQKVADHMVYNAVRSHDAEQRISMHSRHGIRSETLKSAMRMMEDSIEEPITLPVIAKAVHVSTRQLERLFGQYLNCSPSKYFMDLRTHKAHNLIQQTEQSITEIALACGFKSAAHFSRVYRARYGESPMAHRQKNGAD